MDENQRIDRRVRKTEKAIFSALITLLSERPLSDITIRELTESADIHRATFYDHYTDINACFEALQTSTLAEFNAVLKSSPELDYALIYSNILSYIRSNQETYRILLGRNGSSDFQGRMAALIEADYLGNIRREYPSAKANKSWEYIAAYHTTGNIGMISRWIENGCTISMDQMVHLLLSADRVLDSLYGVSSPSGRKAKK